MISFLAVIVCSVSRSEITQALTYLLSPRIRMNRAGSQIVKLPVNASGEHMALQRLHRWCSAITQCRYQAVAVLHADRDAVVIAGSPNDQIIAAYRCQYPSSSPGSKPAELITWHAETVRAHRKPIRARVLHGGLVEAVN